VEHSKHCHIDEILFEEFNTFILEHSTCCQLLQGSETREGFRDILTSFLEKKDKLQPDVVKAFKAFWDAVITQVIEVIGSFRSDTTFLKCNHGRLTPEGLDLVMLWKSSKEADQNTDEKVYKDACTAYDEYHIAAIELKDRRDVSSAQWRKKLDSLMSHRCVIWWLKALYSKEMIQFHIVLAGREDTTVN
jgi:hypothetical protein